MSGFKPKGRHQEKRLSAAFVRSATKAGLYGDGNGLYLKVDPSGARRWVQRIVIHRKRRDIGIGPVSIISLSDARAQAVENRLTVRRGDDPILLRKQSQEIPTFEVVARQYHNDHLPHWRNPKHGKQWLSTLEEYAFPHFGSKRVDKVTAGDLRDALLPIWTKLPETARRVKQRIGTVLKAAIAQDYRADNPATAISSALPRHDRSKVAHRKALHYAEVGKALQLVRDSEALLSTKLAFEFLVLTATRSGETRGAKWTEVDIAGKVWTIPAERMKMKKAHRVPLSPRCIEILKTARSLQTEGQALVFPGLRDNALSDMTLSKLLRELGIDAHPHGFRSSFRDWGNEKTSYPHQVMEMALAHTIPNKAEAAYSRSDLFEKREKMMGDWAKYCNRF